MPLVINDDKLAQKIVFNVLDYLYRELDVLMHDNMKTDKVSEIQVVLNTILSIALQNKPKEPEVKF